ncbi:MAG: hypothetical protein KDE63_10080 [Novosphingobium sp.]|nr:hypothetical protein [Novosphingobium sp.]
MSGLREKGKRNNIRKIISAAETLIGSKKSTNFTMIELAKSANVSTFTTHNLIGTKSSVLFMLLIKHLDDIKILPLHDGADDFDVIKYFLSFGDAPVDMYLANEDYYRPLIGYLMGVSTPGLRSEYIRKAWGYWIHAVSLLSQRKLILDGINDIDLVRSIYTSYAGTMELWVHGEVFSDGLRSQIKSNLVIYLMSATDKKYRDFLLDVLTECREKIESHTIDGI